MPKSKLVNLYDELVQNLAVPSNRRPDSQVLGIPKFLWSVDRITVVGNLKEKIWYQNGINVFEVDFRQLMRLNENAYVKPAGIDSWKIVDSFGENVCFIEIVKFREGLGRIDFNPNKISKFLADDMKSFIHRLFINPHFSRADIACDIINIKNDFIREYRIFEPVKSHYIYGKNGLLETAYWGSRSSERQIRLYNKYIEQHFKKQEIPESIETWWRFELQLRRAKANDWANMVVESLSKFNNPKFITGASNRERLVIKAIIADSSCWDLVSVNSKTKYKKLFNSANDNDILTRYMIEIFKKQQGKLKEELDTWLRGYDVSKQ